MPILYDPYTKASIHNDSLIEPNITSDGDGDFVVHRERGTATYKSLQIPPAELPAVTAEDNGDVLTVVSGEWTNAAPATPPAELPTAPTTDGAYVLACTVDEGEATLSWEAAPASGD